MFSAGQWSRANKDWTLDGVIYRTGDGKEKYRKAVKEGKLDNWLAKVGFYTALEYYNKVRSLDGSNGKLYINELCLDTVKEFDKNNTLVNTRDTLLKQKLDELSFKPNKDEQKLLDLWNKIIEQVKEIDNYNSKFTYGPYQIKQELNTFDKIPTGKSYKRVYHYPKLNGNLKSLRKLVKAYYIKYIQDTLFEYEFLK
jgi:hypothetical protein